MIDRLVRWLARRSPHASQPEPFTPAPVRSQIPTQPFTPVTLPLPPAHDAEFHEMKGRARDIVARWQRLSVQRLRDGEDVLIGQRRPPIGEDDPDD